jgi:hypothetical protein
VADETPLPDLQTELPDLAHEALRQCVVSALEQVTVQVQRVEDMLLVLQATMDLGQSTVTAGRGERGSRALVQRIDALQARIDALEGRPAAAQRTARPPD